MKQQTTIIYYTVLAVIVGVQLFQTVLLGSLQVAHGSSTSQLDLQAKQLQQSLSLLEQKKAAQVSLATAQEFAGSKGFVAINKPVTVGVSTTVASR